MRKERSRRLIRDQKAEKPLVEKKKDPEQEKWEKRIESLKQQGLLTDQMLVHAQAIIDEPETWKIAQRAFAEKLPRVLVEGRKEKEERLSNFCRERKLDPITSIAYGKILDFLFDNTIAERIIASGGYSYDVDESESGRLNQVESRHPNDSNNFRWGLGGWPFIPRDRGYDSFSEFQDLAEGLFGLLAYGLEVNEHAGAHRTLFFRRDAMTLIRSLAEDPEVFKYLFRRQLTPQALDQLVTRLNISIGSVARPLNGAYIGARDITPTKEEEINKSKRVADGIIGDVKEFLQRFKPQNTKKDAKMETRALTPKEVRIGFEQLLDQLFNISGLLREKEGGMKGLETPRNRIRMFWNKDLQEKYTILKKKVEDLQRLQEGIYGELKGDKYHALTGDMEATRDQLDALASERKLQDAFIQQSAILNSESHVEELAHYRQKHLDVE